MNLPCSCTCAVSAATRALRALAREEADEHELEESEEDRDKYRAIRAKWDKDASPAVKAADGGRPTQGDLVYVTDGTWQSVKEGKLDPDVTKALAMLAKCRSQGRECRILAPSARAARLGHPLPRANFNVFVLRIRHPPTHTHT